MNKEERSKMMAVPTTSRPGWDYYWDYKNHKWVQVKDDDDMTWWMDRLVKDGSKSVSGMLSGKEWKEMFHRECEVFDYYL